MWRNVWSLWFVTGLAWLLQPSAFAENPSLPDVERVLRVLDSADDKTESFEIRGSGCLDKGLEFSVILAYRKPDEWLLKIQDAVDETPILWLKNRQMLFYAPGDATVYLNDDDSRFDLKLEKANDGENSLKLKLGFGVGNKPSSVVFDPGFLFQSVKTSEIKLLREQTYELSVFYKRDKRGTAIIDLSRQQALQSLVLQSDGDAKPVLTIKSIRWNEGVADAVFVFPDPNELRMVTAVQELKVNSPVEAAGLIWSIAQSVMIRLGIQKPEARKRLSEQPKLGWDTIQSNDQRVSALLRRTPRS